MKDSSITYGPFTNVGPNSAKEVSVHYENNSPFLTVTEMTRLIEVSHWGNVAVEEEIDMLHTGAKLKGEWDIIVVRCHPIVNLYGMSVMSTYLVCV